MAIKVEGGKALMAWPLVEELFCGSTHSVWYTDVYMSIVFHTVVILTGYGQSVYAALGKPQKKLFSSWPGH